MAKKKIELILDLGNSQTRGLIRANFEDENGKLITHAFKNTNEFTAVDDEYELEEIIEDGDYDNKTSFAISVDMAHKVRKLQGILVSGEIMERNYGTRVSPVATVPKYSSWLVLSAILKAIDTTLTFLQKYSKSDKVTKSDIAQSIDLELYMCVPPAQTREATKRFNEIFATPYKYEDLFTHETIRVEVSQVSIQPEGLMAFFAKMFSYDTLGLRLGSEQLRTQRVLILDIGAGTTDIMAVNNGKLMDKVRTTVNVGANNVVSSTVERYNKRNQTNLSEDLFKNIMENPNIKVGENVYDVTKYMTIAKKEVAREIVAKLTTFLRAQSIDLNSFNKLAVVGGGAMGIEDGTRISDYILDGILDFIPEIGLISMKGIVEPKLNTEEINFGELRMLNLLGLATVVAMHDNRSI